MQNSVFLDTSFLISLSVPARPHHEASKKYYQYFVENKYVMFVSTIVLSEFCRKQPLSDLPMNNFIIVPFNITDALRAAEFAELLQGAQDDSVGSRDSLKDDVKIIAQADMKQAASTFIRDRERLLKTQLSAAKLMSTLSSVPEEEKLDEIIVSFAGAIRKETLALGTSSPNYEVQPNFYIFKNLLNNYITEREKAAYIKGGIDALNRPYRGEL